MQPAGYGLLTASQLDATFAALADATRRAILARLATGQASVTELAQPFAMSQAAISKHLKVLERAGLVSGAREAQRRPRRLEPAPLAAASDWLERYREYWERSFQQLDALLAEMQGTPATRTKGTPATRAKETPATRAKGGSATRAKGTPAMHTKETPTTRTTSKRKPTTRKGARR